jgi:hypothetical protein
LLPQAGRRKRLFWVQPHPCDIVQKLGATIPGWHISFFAVAAVHWTPLINTNPSNAQFNRDQPIKLVCLTTSIVCSKGKFE